jgi:hypothetical protein
MLFSVTLFSFSDNTVVSSNVGSSSEMCSVCIWISVECLRGHKSTAWTHSPDGFYPSAGLKFTDFSKNNVILTVVVMRLQFYFKFSVTDSHKRVSGLL